MSLIETRAARLAAERDAVRAPPTAGSAPGDGRRAYLRAFADGVRATGPVPIQDLERGADAWRSLVPDSPEIRAELARLLGERHRFTRASVPRIARALGLDEPGVRRAHLEAAGEPLPRIYAHRLPATERLRWARSGLGERIDSLSPFWTAFALTLTETVGAGTLALPIAFAAVGPVAGAALLVLLGLVNLLTVACLAEASARSGSIRYGSAFVGRLVHDYLGAPASLLFRIALFAFCCIVLASYYTGFAATLASATGIAAPVWVALICGVGLCLVLCRSLVGTLASALLIGAINVSILVLLSVVALAHATPENLLHAPASPLDGRGLDPSHLELVFGVVMVSYFGHLSVSNCAQTVLRRDPGGRSLVRGTAAAMLVAIGIYCLWSVGVAGAVGAEALGGRTGTALEPLAERIGPEARALGVVFAVLGLGMSSVHFGLGIANMARELAGRCRVGATETRAGRRAEALAASAPVATVFVYVQWTYLNGTPSFTAPLELIGALLTPVLAGLFPVLLLLAGRARGLPARGAVLPSIVSNRAILSAVALLSFAGLLAHGLVLWEDWPRRAAALLVAAVMLGLCVDLVRRGAFAPTLHVGLRRLPGDGDVAEVSVALAGRAIERSVRLRHAGGAVSALRPDRTVRGFGALRTIAIAPPATRVCRVLVTALSVAADHEARALGGRLTLAGIGGATTAVELDPAAGSTRATVPGGIALAELSFASGHARPDGDRSARPRRPRSRRGERRE